MTKFLLPIAINVINKVDDLLVAQLEKALFES